MCERQHGGSKGEHDHHERAPRPHHDHERLHDQKRRADQLKYVYLEEGAPLLVGERGQHPQPCDRKVNGVSEQQEQCKPA
jgi:hypothetical protein